MESLRSCSLLYAAVQVVYVSETPDALRNAHVYPECIYSTVPSADGNGIAL